MLERLLEQRLPVKAIISDTTKQSECDLDLNCTLVDSREHCVSAETYDHSHRAALAGRKCISVSHTAYVNKYQKMLFVTVQ